MTPFLSIQGRAPALRVSHGSQKLDFYETEEAVSGNPIVIYVPNRANRRVHGIGIQHRPKQRERENAQQEPVLIPIPILVPEAHNATQIFHYLSVAADVLWILFASLHLSRIPISLLLPEYCRYHDDDRDLRTENTLNVKFFKYRESLFNINKITKRMNE